MCGIAGFCNRPRNWKNDIEQMKQAILHRGPDAGGTWAEENAQVVLGHRRLSILDLSESGAQPMISHSGRFVIAFNGEIYNHKEIRNKLEKEGRLNGLRSSSDTEILLEALEAYGVKEGISLCKGMFAIALYDRQEKELYLLRDRVGEKPLYYGFVNGSFVFASELSAIAGLPDFSNKINKEVLPIYLVHGYIPAPHSIYEGIYKLEPGRILRTRAPFKEFFEETYWSMTAVAKKGQSNLFTGTREEASEELERLLKNAIRGQMVADVPLGAFLSAGIDSTTIVSLMQSMDPGKVKTFTIGMAEEAFNEAVIAKEIAAYLGTEHTELYISQKDAREVIPLLPGMFGEPFGDSSQIPTYLVSRMTRERVTVSLSGDGGDELFGGYTTYGSVPALWNRMNKIPAGIRGKVSDFLLSEKMVSKGGNGARGLLLSAKTPEELYELSNQAEPLVKDIPLDKKCAPYQATKQAPGLLNGIENNMMLQDLLMYHPDDILVKVDRSAMAVSLETRVPMLDKDVVEFAWTLPVSYKRENGTGKQVLRDVLYKYVPREMMERPKKGFSIPVAKWLKEPELRAWAETLLDKRFLIKQGLFDADVVTGLWSDFIEKGIWRKQIWFLLMFQEWYLKERRGA